MTTPATPRPTLVELLARLATTTDTEERQHIRNAILDANLAPLRKIIERKLRQKPWINRQQDSLCQQLIVKLMKQIDAGKQFNDTDHLLHYAEQAVNNNLVDDVRKQSRNKEEVLGTPSDSGLDPLQAKHDSGYEARPAEEQLADLELWDQFTASYMKLDPLEQTVFRLHFFEGLTQKQITQKLGKDPESPKDVKAISRLWNNATYRLRDYLRLFNDPPS